MSPDPSLARTPDLSAATVARWEIVDAHRCTVCGHLDTDGYRMVEHLRTHDPVSEPAQAALLASDQGRAAPLLASSYEWATACLDCRDGARVHDTEAIAREVQAQEAASELTYEDPHRIVLMRRLIPEWEQVT